MLLQSAAPNLSPASHAPWKLGSDGAVTEKNVDGGGKQEGARQYAFTGAGHVRVSGPSIDLTRQTNAQLSLRIDYRVDTAPKGKVTLTTIQERPSRRARAWKHGRRRDPI